MSSPMGSTGSRPWGLGLSIASPSGSEGGTRRRGKVDARGHGQPGFLIEVSAAVCPRRRRTTQRSNSGKAMPMGTHDAHGRGPPQSTRRVQVGRGWASGRGCLVDRMAGRSGGSAVEGRGPRWAPVGGRGTGGLGGRACPVVGGERSPSVGTVTKRRWEWSPSGEGRERRGWLEGGKRCDKLRDVGATRDRRSFRAEI